MLTSTFAGDGEGRGAPRPGRAHRRGQRLPPARRQAARAPREDRACGVGRCDRRPREGRCVPEQAGNRASCRPGIPGGSLMHLTREEEDLAANGTEAERLSMRILTTLGDVYGADRLLPIASAHVSGVSLKTLGEPGLEFLESFSRTAKVRVRTTVNPMGIDLERWRELGVSADFAAKQERIANAYRTIGCEASF